MNSTSSRALLNCPRSDRNKRRRERRLRGRSCSFVAKSRREQLQQRHFHQRKPPLCDHSEWRNSSSDKPLSVRRTTSELIGDFSEIGLAHARHCRSRSLLDLAFFFDPNGLRILSTTASTPVTTKNALSFCYVQSRESQQQRPTQSLPCIAVKGSANSFSISNTITGAIMFLGLRLRSSLWKGLALRAGLLQKLWSRQVNPDISR
jgi:hypothetical protein